MSPVVDTRAAWPALSLDEWRDTYATLHMWTQIVGKTSLALARWQNHWWQVALHVTARGLATGPMPYGSRTLDVEFDFVEHELVLRTDDGAVHEIPLRPRSVAEFYRLYLKALETLAIQVKLWPMPVEVENPIRFTDDRTHASYDPEHANRFWRILVQADDVLKRFRGSIGRIGRNHQRCRQRETGHEREQTPENCPDSFTALDQIRHYPLPHQASPRRSLSSPVVSTATASELGPDRQNEHHNRKRARFTANPLHEVRAAAPHQYRIRCNSMNSLGLSAVRPWSPAGARRDYLLSAVGFRTLEPSGG